MAKSYSEMCKFKTFEERFNYLNLDGYVGESTFGSDRYLNQVFYKSPEWKATRRKIIIRDNGCDLGIKGREINRNVIVHHINPITKEDIINRNPCLFDPENLVCTIKNTHDAIHYSDENLLVKVPKERTKNDTCPWKK